MCIRDRFPAEAAEDREKLMADFLVQLYSRRADIPPEILLSEPSEDRELAEAYLRELRGRPVTLAVPQRGEKRKLCDMVSANAAETLRLLMTRAERQSKLVAEDVYKRQLTRHDRAGALQSGGETRRGGFRLHRCGCGRVVCGCGELGCGHRHRRRIRDVYKRQSLSRR